MLPNDLSQSREDLQSVQKQLDDGDDVSERNASQKSKRDESDLLQNDFSFNQRPGNFFLDGVNDPQQRKMIQNIENKINGTGLRQIQKNIQNLRRNTNQLGAFFQGQSMQENYQENQNESREMIKQPTPVLQQFLSSNSRQNSFLRMMERSKSRSSSSIKQVQANPQEERKQSIKSPKNSHSSSSEDGQKRYFSLNQMKKRRKEVKNQVSFIKSNIEEVDQKIELCSLASRYGLGYKRFASSVSPVAKQENKQSSEDLGNLGRNKSIPQRNSQKIQLSSKSNSCIQISNNAIEIQQQSADQINLNHEYKNAIRKRLTLNHTKQNKFRGKIGPKPMNKYDRQQVTQFVYRIEKQNNATQRNLIIVNNGIHQLLRGAQTPAVIQEEENENSQSNPYNQSFDQLSLKNRGVLSNGYLCLNNSCYSSLLDNKQFQELNPNDGHITKKSSKKKRNTNTSSMFNMSFLNRSSLNGPSIYGGEQDRSDSNLSLRSKTNLSDISRLQRNINKIQKEQQPVFIVCKNEGSGQKNLSQEQIDQVLKKYREQAMYMKKNTLRNSSSSRSKSESSGDSLGWLDVCKINIDHNDQISMIIQRMRNDGAPPKPRRFKSKFKQQQSSLSSGSDHNLDLEENLANPNRGGINIVQNQGVILEEYEFDGSSLMNQRVRRVNSQSQIQNVQANLFNRTAKFQASHSRMNSDESAQSSMIIPKRNSSQVIAGTHSSHHSSSIKSIVIDKDDVNPFISGKRLKNKANEKQLESKFRDSSSGNIEAMKRLLEEEKSQHQESIMSKLSKLNVANDLVMIEEINEEEEQKLQQTLQQNSSSVGVDERKQLMNNLIDIIDMKSLEDKDFIKSTYLKQQTKRNLKVKYIEKEIKKEDSYSSFESYHYTSSDVEENFIKLNTTPNPIQGKNQKSNFETDLSSEVPFFMDDSQQGTGDIHLVERPDGSGQSDLYTYNEREQKLMTKVIKLMRPARQNRIWNNVFMSVQDQEQQDIYKSIEKLVFERDPTRQLKVSMLDYNSLDQYYGPLIFVDGMTEIKFNGKRALQKSEQIKNNSCAGFIKKQVYNFNKLNISNVQLQSIPFSSVIGLVYGPKSISFKQYLKKNFRDEDIMRVRCDQWRFMSIITTYQSYDLIMESLEDSFDLIIAINEALIKQNDQELRTQLQKIQQMNGKQVIKKYNSINEANPVTEILVDEELENFKQKWIDQLTSDTKWQNQVMKFSTRKKVIKFQMLRMKIIDIAEEPGYSMSQYFMITIYNTICDWPEDTIEQSNKKLDKLKEVLAIIKRHSKLRELLEVIDTSTQKRLQRVIHKKRLLQIMDMSEEQRQMELKSFFTSHSLFGMKDTAKNEEMFEQIQPDVDNPTSQQKKSSFKRERSQSEQMSAWKKWLTQKTKPTEDIDEQEVKTSLAKKIRSIKYLDHLRQKRQKRIEIEQQLKQVELRGSKKVQKFFNQGLMRLIKKKPSTENEQLEDFNGNEFNYYEMTKEVLEKRKYEIIKWSKSLYCKENRVIKQQQKPQRFDEIMLKKMWDEQDDEIIRNQDLIASEIKLINRSGCMSDFRAVPITSIFDLSTGQQPKIEKTLGQIENLGASKLEELKAQEDSLTIEEYLAARSKVSKIANVEWKYEYKRQQVLLKKVIEISIMKKEFDNLPEHEKKMRVMSMLVDNQRSEAKSLRNLMSVEVEKDALTSTKKREESSSSSSSSSSSTD